MVVAKGRRERDGEVGERTSLLVNPVVGHQDSGDQVEKVRCSVTCGF